MFFSLLIYWRRQHFAHHISLSLSCTNSQTACSSYFVLLVSSSLVFFSACFLSSYILFFSSTFPLSHLPPLFDPMKERRRARRDSHASGDGKRRKKSFSSASFRCVLLPVLSYFPSYPNIPLSTLRSPPRVLSSSFCVNR